MTQRNLEIEKITARESQHCYGMGLGVLILDDIYPGFPGDVRNASAFPYPIQYAIVEGVDINRLVVEKDKSPCLPPIIDAAKKLENYGCKALVAECGYFSYFQKEIAESVGVPVFSSSLLQVPLAQQIVGSDRLVGILLADLQYVTDHHLESVNIKLGSNYVLEGAMDNGLCKEFDKLWTDGKRSDPPSALYSKAKDELLDQAVTFFNHYENMGALVLECSGFPPFARALQQKIHIPVFSFGTLMDYAYSVSVHRDYYGHI